jgi:cbb3-type cytochrome c oxidase subunit III
VSTYYRNWEVIVYRSGRIAAGALCAAILSACGAEPPEAHAESATATTAVALRPFTGDTAVAQQGRVLFLKNNCYSCHGGLAGGGMGPSLRDTTWKYGGTDEAIFSSVHDGRPMGMPAWGGTLSADEIKTILVYVRSLRTPAEPTGFFWAVGDTTRGTTR